MADTPVVVNNPPKWYDNLFTKIILEVVLALSMWLIYFIVRRVLPKKYRLKDKNIKNLMRDFSAVSGALVNEKSDLPEIFSKARQLFDYFYEKKNHVNNHAQEFYVFLKDIDEDVEYQKNWAFMNLIFPKIEHFAVSSRAVQELGGTGGPCIYEYVFDFKNEGFVTFYIIKQPLFFDEHNPFDYFAVSKDFNYMGKMLELLFDSYDNKVYIHMNPDTGKVACAQLDHKDNNNYIPNPKVFNPLWKEISYYKKQGEQRSYLMVGPPGAGKTSFCLELSKKASGKILKIDSGVFIRLAGNAVRSLIENLNVDFIIVDDIDRIKTNDMAAFLYCLEAVKTYSRKPTLLATCNNIKNLELAAIRPGRFDDIFEFDLPTCEERERFIVTMLNKHNTICLTQEQIHEFAMVTAGFTNAYLDEYVGKLRIDKNFKTLMRKIKQRKKYLGDFTPGELDAFEEQAKNLAEDDDEGAVPQSLCSSGGTPVSID
jgi:hypothetical protein